MINATTPASERVLHEEVAARPVRRLGAGAFWALIGVELVILFCVLIWTMGWLSPAPTPVTPYAAASQMTPVRYAIVDRLSGAVPDPLVQVRPGVMARESNLRGFRLDGTTYYYYLEGEQNFDPLSTGLVSADAVEVLLRDENGARTLVIYIISGA